jgi:GxxExxY protein
MMEPSAKQERIAREVVGAAFAVHAALGPGLLESVYEECLGADLVHRGFNIRRQAPVSIFYRNLRLDAGFRIDLLVENEVIVEVKAVERLIALHEAQILTYLKLSGQTLGLLINFNVPLIKSGIRRFVRSV